MKIKGILTLALACFLCPASAQEILVVNITYAERDGPQGDYLLVGNSNERFSLKSISENLAETDAKIDEIIPSLEKQFPYLAGKITVFPLKVDTGKLAETGKVFIFGQVKNPGTYDVDTLGTCINQAVPAEFASIKRILVISGQKISKSDITQKTYSEVKLQAGDIVMVPMKYVIGR